MNKPKVLIADDDTTLLYALRVHLEHEGFEVLTASNGYQALAQARVDQPDVLVLDIHMPAGNGFSVQDRLEKLTNPTGLPRQQTPVIYITGEKSPRIKNLAKQAGAFALVHKPFEIDELCQIIIKAAAPPLFAA